MVKPTRSTKSTVEIREDKIGRKYVMDKPRLETLLDDPDLEEIMINGPESPVFIFHRDHGMCETNLMMSEEKILNLIADVANKSADYINANKPFLNARLPDGSRFNATIPPATPWGPTVTIRKFKENPLSIVDLVELGTISEKLASFLWMCVEGEKNYPMNILVIGGAGSGKTTTLNTLSAFIPEEERIIAIEDTLELNFYGRKNVIRMESIVGSETRKEITMNDLLQNALRMRPDRLVMGEVRGSEAESLFNAMNVGHSAMGTLHANSAGEAVARLTNPPMNVPENMLPLVDIIILETKIRSPQGLKRRVSSVVEVSRTEAGVGFSDIFEYDPKTDRISRTNVPSQKEEELAKLAGLTRLDIKKKNEERNILIKSWRERGIRNFQDIQREIKKYHTKKI